MQRREWIIVGVTALLLVPLSEAIFYRKGGAVSAPEVSEPKKPVVEKPAVESEEEVQMRAAMAGILSLRTGAKDPESFVLRSVVIKDSGVVCYEFRAKNSYGAEMPGEAVLTKKKLFIHEQDGNAFVRAWNKECTGEGGKEVAPGLAKWLTRINRRAAGG